MAKRKRRLSKARRRKRNMTRVILLLLLFFAVYKGIAHIITNWAHYNIETVEVAGARLYKTESLQDLKGENIFKTDLRRLHRTITAEDFVESVVIKRVLPGKIEITISERTPVASVGDEHGSYRCIDAGGYEFEDPEGGSLPRIYQWDKGREAVLEFYASGAFSFDGYDVTEIDCRNIYELKATYKNREGKKLTCNYGSGDYADKSAAVSACVENGETASYADLRFLPYVVLGNGGGV